VSPNVHAPDGGRPLFDYVTEAALLMPCALNAAAFDGVAMARPGGIKSVPGNVRCASLHDAGQLRATSAQLQADEALGLLHAGGWTDAAIAAGAISTSFDLWRAVAVTYASAYARTPADAMPCGYAFQGADAKGMPQSPSVAVQAAWWSDSAGIPPGQGVGIHDGMAAGADPLLPGLQCLRGLWKDAGAMSDRVRAGVAATRASLPRAGLPVIVIHGVDDGLVPEAFSGGAYAAASRAAGRDLRYWRVANAQHFDAFLGLPVLGANYLPMLPYAYRALDRMWSHIETGAALPASAEIATRKRTLGPAGLSPLVAEDLALP
jgi:hydroxybutyrate-dimer hydrolase